MPDMNLRAIPVMRTALEQIQELHKPKHGERPESYDVDYAEPLNWIKYTICANCHTEYPCATRNLADEGLTDRMARTNQGENNE